MLSVSRLLRVSHPRNVLSGAPRLLQKGRRFISGQPAGKGEQPGPRLNLEQFKSSKSASERQPWFNRKLNTYVSYSAIVFAAFCAVYRYDVRSLDDVQIVFRNAYSSAIRFVREPSSGPMLPSRPPLREGEPYRPVLVIGLEDVLVHREYNASFGWRVAKRPGVDDFLNYITQLYEVIIFSDGMRMNDDIMESLDPHHFTVPLYRSNMTYLKPEGSKKGKYYKDLTRLNRDLQHVLVIDKDMSILSQGDNAVVIPPFSDSRHGDQILKQLIPILEHLSNPTVQSIPKELEKLGHSGEDVVASFHRQKDTESLKNQLLRTKKRLDQSVSEMQLSEENNPFSPPLAPFSLLINPELMGMIPVLGVAQKSPGAITVDDIIKTRPLPEVEHYEKRVDQTIWERRYYAKKEELKKRMFSFLMATQQPTEEFQDPSMMPPQTM